MSNHNYSQYSNKKQDKPVVEAVETVIEPEVEETFQAPTQIIEPAVVVAEPEVNDVPEIPVTGVIINCTRLNVRENPDSKADVLCVLDKNTEVEIDMTQSTSDFFRVTTASGVEGFCMRQFVEAHL